MIYQFADWELDTERYLLARAGQSVKLRRQVFHVLAYLLAQPGRVVSTALAWARGERYGGRVLHPSRAAGHW